MKPMALAVFFVLGTSLLAEETPDLLMRTFRDDSGLSVPVLNEALAASSRERARELGALGSLSHQDSSGRGVGLQLTAQGLPPGEFGEVLGAGSDLPSVWNAWLRSPAHLAILKTAGWTQWGWGAWRQGETTVWVVRFWRP